MNTKMKQIVSVIALNAFLLQTMVAPAFAGISNLPPLVKPNVFPNIFFTLDDSGSMMFEHMPDSVAPSYAMGFPQPKGVYKDGSTPMTYVVPFGDDVGTPGTNTMSLRVARFRSSSFNSIYYNPAIRYDPWVDANGVPMAPANPEAARFNPVAPDDGNLVATINLLSSNQSAAQASWNINPEWINSTPGEPTSTERRDFYPAVYFNYIGGVGCVSATAATSVDCFQKVEIRDTTPTYPKSTERTDCLSSTCTFDEEKVNFANWFQYWRSRMLLARGGTGIAFGRQSSNIRVGFGAINANPVVISGVSNDFGLINRASFYDRLYKYPTGRNGTPLRAATDKVGRYFSRTDYNGPWANVIGDSSRGQASCRQNYHILMTDGYWNGAGSGRGNSDGTDGGVMTAANGDTFRYTTTATYSTTISPGGGTVSTTTPGLQYADSNSDTLADAAMYYWKNDLRPDWDVDKKNVPVNSRDPAFWQHVVMYTVGLGVTGTLDPEVDLPDLTSGLKSWSTPAADSINNVDDLWHAAVNGRGDYFSARDPQQFGASLSAALNDIAGRAGNSAAVGTSSNTVVSGTKLYMTTYNTQNWSGSIKQLNINTSGGIDTTPDWTVGENTVWGSRNIFTYKDSSTKGIAFEFDNLATSDKAYFTNAKSTLFAGNVTENDIVDYLKGNRLKEKNRVNGVFRVRTNLLGDLVGSSPQYVGQGENAGYQYLPTTVPSNGKETYYSFHSVTKRARTPRVYVGANDGMLHAFNASTGVEEFAYVPKTVLSDLPRLADPAYTHRFYVDGTPTIADVHLGDWKTVLVGTTGAGGRGVYALDITGDAFDSSKVLWEWNASNDADIGYTIGRAQVGRTPAGDWVAIFGNGYESASKKAMLFIANLSTGALTKVDTGAGSPTAPNGLATPRLVIDATGTIKGAYAGDLLGNLWKFDFTASSAAVAFSGSRLFRAIDSSNNGQPITVQPDITPHPQGGTMVTFGTGKLFEDSDPSTTSTQTIYGIWDKAGIPTVTATTVADSSVLVRQTQSSAGSGLTLLSNNTVDWNTKRGWYINLSAGERVTIDPATIYNTVFYTTITPGSVTDPCVTSGTSMNLLFDSITGGAINSITLDTNKNGAVESTDIRASGMSVPLTFGSTILRRTGGISIVQPGADGTIGGPPGNCPTPGSCQIPPAKPPPIPALRLWRQILGRN